ncbi:MAG: acetylglutamate kinase [Bacteroidota bacterium]|jgi:acetylglutamate kinase
MRPSLTIVKVGGNIIDDPQKLNQLLSAFAELNGLKILVHGGGKLATQMAQDMKIPQQMIDGRRVTDEATLKIVTMVYAGWINKQIVASLNAINTTTIGITGADGPSILSHKRIHAEIDFGFVGDVDTVNSDFFKQLLEQGKTIVVAPITQDKNGQLLNTNADTIAQEIAKALSASFDVSLIYSFEKKGVLSNIADENSVIKELDALSYQKLKAENLIFAGMIPKLDNAFSAITAGVKRVIIGDATALGDLIAGYSGTTIA